MKPERDLPQKQMPSQPGGLENHLELAASAVASLADGRNIHSIPEHSNTTLSPQIAVSSYHRADQPRLPVASASPPICLATPIAEDFSRGPMTPTTVTMRERELGYNPSPGVMPKSSVPQFVEEAPKIPIPQLLINKREDSPLASTLESENQKIRNRLEILEWQLSEVLADRTSLERKLTSHGEYIKFLETRLDTQSENLNSLGEELEAFRAMRTPAPGNPIPSSGSNDSDICSSSEATVGNSSRLPRLARGLN